MIFVDSNVFIYAVGRSHPLKAEAQNFFLDSSKKGKRPAILILGFIIFVNPKYTFNFGRI